MVIWLSRGEAVFDVANDLFKYRDTGHDTVVTYVDMKKAFNSIHHGLLLQKLRSIY